MTPTRHRDSLRNARLLETGDARRMNARHGVIHREKAFGNERVKGHALKERGNRRGGRGATRRGHVRGVSNPEKRRATASEKRRDTAWESGGTRRTTAAGCENSVATVRR